MKINKVQLTVMIVTILIVGLLFIDSKLSQKIVSAAYIPGPTITQTMIDTWNAKQNAISGSGVLKSTTGTISYISGSSGQFIDGTGSLQNMPTPFSMSGYTSYQAVVSQTGTSAPSVNSSVNGFTGTTMTWSYVSPGTYRITASSAVFTANKTIIILSDPNNPLIQYTGFANSSTQVTISSNVISILTLILTPTATNGILNNTLVEVRVYP